MLDTGHDHAEQRHALAQAEQRLERVKEHAWPRNIIEQLPKIAAVSRVRWHVTTLLRFVRIAKDMGKGDTATEREQHYWVRSEQLFETVAIVI